MNRALSYKAGTLSIILSSIVMFTSVGLGQFSEIPQTVEKSSERLEYERLLTEWRPMVRQLQKLRYSYYDVKRKPGEGQYMVVESTPKREALKKEFNEIFDRTQLKHDQVIQAAVYAYAKDLQRISDYQEEIEKAQSVNRTDVPQRVAYLQKLVMQNYDLERFLRQTLMYFMQRDMYEDALKMAQILISQNVNNPLIIRSAAESALYTCQFDICRKHLEQIHKQGMLNESQLQESDFRFLPLYEQFWDKELKMRQADDYKNDCPRVVLRTTKGEIELLLYEDQCPNTVANFIFLIEKGYYKNLDFHRVIPGFMAQGGGYERLAEVDLKTLQKKIRGCGDPGYSIDNEAPQFNMETRGFPDDARLHWRGSISMALTADPNSAGSQFFIMYKPKIDLNGAYTSFGRVIRGMDIVTRLQSRDPQKAVTEDALVQADKIIDAKVLFKRNHDYNPLIHPNEKKKPPFPNMPVVEADQKEDPDDFDVLKYIQNHMP